MSKQRGQGTRHESWAVTCLRAAGFADAHRLAEGGTADEGDVAVTLYGEGWVGEAKARQTLNVQETLGKARRKAGGRRVFLVWKRLVRVEGKATRQPVAGERTVVVISWDDFIAVLHAAEKYGADGVTSQQEG